MNNNSTKNMKNNVKITFKKRCKILPELQLPENVKKYDPFTSQFTKYFDQLENEADHSTYYFSKNKIYSCTNK